MRQSKVMLSAGLAFFEEFDMKRLRQQALRGWHLKRFNLLGYRLEKGEPENIIYTIDYHRLKEEEQEEYIEMFQLAGWEHVCSEYNMHIFKAPEETKPIYSDADTKKEKYHRLSKIWKNASIIFLTLFVTTWIIKLNTTASLYHISNIGMTLSIILFVPTFITYLAIVIRLYKNKSKVE